MILEEIFSTTTPVIGVIHLLPLPGSHKYDGQFEPVLLRAEQEAASLASGGVDGIIVENFFDAPFTAHRVDTATACALALIARRVKEISNLPLGINVLRNDGLTALAVAATSGAEFVRVNVYTGAMLTDQGVIQGQAHELHMYRRMLSGQSKIHIFADIMVKHAAPLTPFADIRQAAKDTIGRGGADAIIISGTATGSAPDKSDLESVREAVPNAAILIGSGADRENVAGLLQVANGIIVASSLKRQGKLQNPVDVERVRAFVSAAKQSAPKPAV